MTIAVDWDVKHQFKQTNIVTALKETPVLVYLFYLFISSVCCMLLISREVVKCQKQKKRRKKDVTGLTEQVWLPKILIIRIICINSA